MSYLKSAPSKLSNLVNFVNKKICKKFRPKNTLFGYFQTGTLKKYCHILKQHLRISVIPKFCEETTMPKFRTKNVFSGIFDQKCLIWVFLGKNLKKIVIFEISTLKFASLQNFSKKQKYLNLGPKMHDLGILRPEFENNIVIFEISTFELV